MREKVEDDRTVELDKRQAELDARERSLAETERAHSAKDEELSARQKSLEEQEQAHARIAHNELAASLGQVRQLGEDLKERREELIRAMPLQKDRLLDDQRQETNWIDAAIAQASVRRDAMNR